jgi:hypothetical protein
VHDARARLGRRRLLLGRRRRLHLGRRQVLLDLDLDRPVVAKALRIDGHHAEREQPVQADRDRRRDADEA